MLECHDRNVPLVSFICFLKSYFLLSFVFSYTRSSLLHMALPQLQQAGLLFVAVSRLLIAVASLVEEHGLQTRGVRSCGTLAQLLHHVQNLPEPGIEPVFSTLTGRFLTRCHLGSPPFFLQPKKFSILSSLHENSLVEDRELSPHKFRKYGPLPGR